MNLILCVLFLIYSNLFNTITLLFIEIAFQRISTVVFSLIREVKDVVGEYCYETAEAIIGFRKTPVLVPVLSRSRRAEYERYRSGRF
ncbi:MAG: hypothetical protein BWK80_10880 [Desulfobacteraceae bacterium IS3]|nr:MAG: hypothetical protein BWK80_10880 [Desulfobacteraceae bacterium IS3]